MVFCTKCGTENEDEREYCKNCGNSLNLNRTSRRKYREDEMCFGVPMEGPTWGILVGIIIVLWGVFEIVNIDFNFWALVAVAFGSLMVWNAFKYSRDG